MQFTVTPLQAARLFILSQAVHPEESEAHALRLSMLMEEFARSAMRGTLEAARELRALL